MRKKTAVALTAVTFVVLYLLFSYDQHAYSIPVADAETLIAVYLPQKDTLDESQYCRTPDGAAVGSHRGRNSMGSFQHLRERPLAWAMSELARSPSLRLAAFDLDVVRLADGAYVVSHPADIGRFLAIPPAAVANLSHLDIRGSDRDGVVPDLSEVISQLELLRGRPFLFLELKQPRPDAAGVVAAARAAVRYGASPSRVAFIVSSPALAAEIRALGCPLPLAWAVRDDAHHPYCTDADAAAAEAAFLAAAAPFSILMPSVKVMRLCQRLIAAARGRRPLMRVVAWTADTPADAATAARAGADVVLTNTPWVVAPACCPPRGCKV